MLCTSEASFKLCQCYFLFFKAINLAMVQLIFILMAANIILPFCAMSYAGTILVNEEQPLPKQWLNARCAPLSTKLRALKHLGPEGGPRKFTKNGFLDESICFLIALKASLKWAKE